MMLLLLLLLLSQPGGGDAALHAASAPPASPTSAPRCTQDTLGQLGAVMSGGAHPSQRQLQEAQQPRGSSGQAAFGQPTAPAAAGGASVQNLGVVGRGTKRIKLQPLAVRPLHVCLCTCRCVLLLSEGS